MTQLDIIKAFFEDKEIQQKYGLDENEVARMTMISRHNVDAQILIDLIRQLVKLVEDSGTTNNLAASRLNNILETSLT